MEVITAEQPPTAVEVHSGPPEGMIPEVSANGLLGNEVAAEPPKLATEDQLHAVSRQLLQRIEEAAGRVAVKAEQTAAAKIQEMLPQVQASVQQHIDSLTPQTFLDYVRQPGFSKYHRAELIVCYAVLAGIACWLFSAGRSSSDVAQIVAAHERSITSLQQTVGQVDQVFGQRLADQQKQIDTLAQAQQQATLEANRNMAEMHSRVLAVQAAARRAQHSAERLERMMVAQTTPGPAQFQPPRTK